MRQLYPRRVTTGVCAAPGAAGAPAAITSDPHPLFLPPNPKLQAKVVPQPQVDPSQNAPSEQSEAAQVRPDPQDPSDLRARVRQVAASI